jgi:Tol biopolymer transport system component
LTGRDKTRLSFRPERENIRHLRDQRRRTGEKRLTDDPGTDRIADWSPDGTKISFTSDRSGACAIYTMNPDGNNVQKLTPDSMQPGVAAWSPDGSRLIFSDNFCANVESDFVRNERRRGAASFQSQIARRTSLSKSWSPSGDRVVADFSAVTRAPCTKATSRSSQWLAVQQRI